MDNIRRIRAIKFFNKMYELVYTAEPADPLQSTVTFEVMATEVLSGGKHGLTPAVLSRVHNLSHETARRRLRSLVDDGFVVRRGNEYFLKPNAAYWSSFDRIVVEVERLSEAMVKKQN